MLHNLVEYALADTYDGLRPIFIDAHNQNRVVTRSTAIDLITRLAGAFTRGSTVCLHLANDVLYPVILLSVLASGARWTGTLPTYTAAELQRHYADAKVDLVISEPDRLDTVREAVRLSGRNVGIVAFSDILRPDRPIAHGKCLHDLLSVDPRPLVARLDEIDTSSVAALMQTSGTSGLPKIVVHTHGTILAALASIENAHRSPETPRLFCTPIQHAFPFPEVMFNALRFGVPSVIMPRFDNSFAQVVATHRVKEVYVAPPILQAMVRQPERRHLLASLKRVVYAGCGLSTSITRNFCALFDHPPDIVPVYGMTEAGWFTTLERPVEAHPETSGRILPGLEMKVEADKEEGELLLRGAGVMSEYLDDEDANRRAFTADGWLRTGDVGRISDGLVYLSDRTKDIMRVNGFQVSPSEMEDAATAAEAIADAAALGIGEGIEEHPLLAVVRKTDDIDEEWVLAHLRTRLAGYKVAKTEVWFIDFIPRSAAGKTLRKVLRQEWIDSR